MRMYVCMYYLSTCYCMPDALAALPIKGVSIVRDKDVWLDLKNVVKESLQKCMLQR